jgi:predicted nucleotidyltransferase
VTIGQIALSKLIQGIIQEARPLRIMLFGSAVTIGVDRAGDLDVLVVMPNGTNCRVVARQLYKSLKNVGKPFDLVVSTPQILDRHRENPGLVYKSILDSGKELYAA